MEDIRKENGLLLLEYDGDKKDERCVNKNLPEIELIDIEKWNIFVHENDDLLGRTIVVYTDTWARTMQQKIATGLQLDQCADQASQGIVIGKGLDLYRNIEFVHRCAINILLLTWKYSAELQLWINRKREN